MILAFCSKSYMVQIILIVKTFFKIMCYVVPPIIIIATIIGFTKPVIDGKEEDLKESGKLLVRRLIAGLLIMFIPTIINFVFTSLVDGSDVEFLACFESASKEKVASLKEKEKNEEELKKKAQEVEDKKILEEAYKKEQKQKNNQKKMFEEQKKKREEEKRRQQQQQQQGGGLPGSSELVSTSKPGVSIKSFNASGGSIKYWEITPTNVKSNLPLIIFLHGSGETGSVNGVGRLPIVSYVANQWDRENKPFIFLAPVASSHGWGDKVRLVKGLIDSTVSQYNVDTSHIIITGMSMGGYGTWTMLSHYGSFFSAAVPMSGCSSSYGPNNMTGLPIRAIVGGRESGTKECMANLVKKINNAGGNARLDVKEGATHGTIQPYYKSEELFNWMLSQ